MGKCDSAVACFFVAGKPQVVRSKMNWRDIGCITYGVLVNLLDYEETTINLRPARGEKSFNFNYFNLLPSYFVLKLAAVLLVHAYWN